MENTNEACQLLTFLAQNKKPNMYIDRSVCPVESLGFDTCISKLTTVCGQDTGKRENLLVVFEELPRKLERDEAIQIALFSPAQFGTYVHARLVLREKLKIPMEIRDSKLFFPRTMWQSTHDVYYIPVLQNLTGDGWVIRLHDLDEGLKKGAFVASVNSI